MLADRPDAPRVLVVGDANPDLVLTGDVIPRFGQVEQLLDSATLTIGGSAAITAHALARLGRQVWLVAAVGTDDFADRICHDLAAAGVALDTIVRRPDRPTGLTVVLAQSGDRAILTLPGAIPTLTVEEIGAAVASVLDLGAEGAVAAGHVHVASLYLQPALAPHLPQLLAEFKQHGVTTSLDTNDDPSRTWQGVEALLPHLDVLLPNRAEVVALARDDDPRRAALALAGRGPLVVVKDGATGAFAATPSGELVEQAAEPRVAVDTTGTGDTFDAAFLDAWLCGTALADCLRRAVLAGAFAVGALGGTAGQPTRHDLDVATQPGRTHARP